MNKKKYFLNFLLFLGILLLNSAFWVYKTFDDISMEEIIFHTKVPLEGTSNDLFISFFKEPVIYSVLTFIVLFISLRKVLNKRPYIFKYIKLAIVVFTILSFSLLVNNMNLLPYILNNVFPSSFIEEEFVSPKDVEIINPENKKNLIYIVLESYENSYADKNNGGVMNKSVIGDLTNLAYNNINFSNTDKLGGPRTTVGATWTVAALVAQSSGLPLKYPINATAFDNESSFLPGMTNLGDLLGDFGYNQFFLLGSDIRFASRDKLYQQHGNYNYIDYIEAMNKELIYDGYWQWWGYEDEKLFNFAKDQLTRLSNEPGPFNFTKLTADTHFSDGYKTEGMEEIFDTQYENVIYHSSKQLVEFLDWVQAQPFYEDTTIVIVGDHLTMDGKFAANNFKDNDYVRTLYNVILNSSTVTENTNNRDFTTLDMFPTILSSLGFEIEGNRLGLGTNLFSDIPTLSEQYGFDYINKELGRKSKFYNEVILEMR